MTLSDLIKSAAATGLNSRDRNGYTRSTFKIPAMRPTFSRRNELARNSREWSQADRDWWNEYTAQTQKDWEDQVKNWESQRAADLDAKGVARTAENKHLWNHQAAWDYINKQRNQGRQDESAWTWYNPLNWFNNKQPEVLTQAAETDPVLLEAQKQYLGGYGKEIRQDVVDNRMMAAHAASFSPYYMPQLLDVIGGRDLGDVRGEHEYRVEYANELMNQTGNPGSDLAAKAVAKKTRNIGRTPWNAYFMDKADTDYNPDANPWWGTLANTTGTLEEISRQGGVRSSILNLLGAKTFGWGGLKPLVQVGTPGGFVSRVPGALPFAQGVALGAGVPFVQNVAMRTSPSFATAIGLNPYYNDFEKAWRERYGDLYANGIANDQYMAIERDPNTGEPVRVYNGLYSNKPEDLQNYPDYMQFLQSQGIDASQAANPENQKNYIMDRVNNRATAPEMLFKTQMFMNMKPEDKVDAFETLIKNRYLVETDLFTMGVHAFDSKAEMLSYALEHDHTGRMNALFDTFLTTADVPTLTKFLESHAGTGTSSKAGDTSFLFDKLQQNIVQNIKANPNGAYPLINNLVKLQAAQSLRDSSSPEAASQGAMAVKKAFAEALADPDVVDNMSAKNVVQLAQLLAQTSSSSSGMTSLGENGAELTAKVKENIQTRLRDAVLEDPEVLPMVASIYADSKGWTGIAEAIKNPWVFWLSAATLLAGGVFLVSSVFDSDEDEEDEDEEDDGTGYHEMLRRNPYA